MLTFHFHISQAMQYTLDLFFIFLLIALELLCKLEVHLQLFSFHLSSHLEINLM